MSSLFRPWSEREYAVWVSQCSHTDSGYALSRSQFSGLDGWPNILSGLRSHRANGPTLTPRTLGVPVSLTCQGYRNDAPSATLMLTSWAYLVLRRCGRTPREQVPESLPRHSLCLLTGEPRNHRSQDFQARLKDADIGDSIAFSASLEFVADLIDCAQ